MNGSFIRKIILFFLIALSLFLSWNIWTAGSRVEETSPTTGTTSPGVIFDRSLTNVFGPVQIAVHEEGRTRITSNEGILSELNDSMVDWTIEELEDPVFLSANEMEVRVNQQPMIVFVFEGMIPFGLFDEVFNNLPGEYEDRTFNRIFLSIHNPANMMFYNNETEMVYQAEVTGITEEMINTLAFNDEKNYFTVELYDFGNQKIYLPNEAIEVPYFDYLVERLPNSLFVDRFFDDTSEVDVRRSGNLTRYINLVSEMRINEVSNILSFSRQRTSEPLPLSENAESTYRELLRVETWTQETHFHHYDPENNVTTYRRYIEGLPVFGPNGEGAVEISVVQTGISYLQVPLNVVQTPIAHVEDSYTRRLESGTELQTLMVDAGINLDTIDNLRVGMTWTTSDESSRVVHFEPEWYVAINSEWFTLGQLLSREGDAE